MSPSVICDGTSSCIRACSWRACFPTAVCASPTPWRGSPFHYSTSFLLRCCRVFFHGFLTICRQLPRRRRSKCWTRAACLRNYAGGAWRRPMGALQAGSLNHVGEHRRQDNRMASLPSSALIEFCVLDANMNNPVPEPLAAWLSDPPLSSATLACLF